MSSAAGSTWDNFSLSSIDYATPTLTDLEEAIGLRGRLRRILTDNHGATNALQLVNDKYGTFFTRARAALEFMDMRVEEEKQKARSRANKYRGLDRENIGG